MTNIHAQENTYASVLNATTFAAALSSRLNGAPITIMANKAAVVTIRDGKILVPGGDVCLHPQAEEWGEAIADLLAQHSQGLGQGKKIGQIDWRLSGLASPRGNKINGIHIDIHACAWCLSNSPPTGSFCRAM